MPPLANSVISPTMERTYKSEFGTPLTLKSYSATVTSGCPKSTLLDRLFPKPKANVSSLSPNIDINRSAFY